MSSERRSEARTFVVLAIGAGFTAWDLGFDLGAFDTIDHRRFWAIWILCTVALVASYLFRDAELEPIGRWRFVFIVPTLWLVADFLLTQEDNTATVVPLHHLGRHAARRRLPLVPAPRRRLLHPPTTNPTRPRRPHDHHLPRWPLRWRRPPAISHLRRLRPSWRLHPRKLHPLTTGAATKESRAPIGDWIDLRRSSPRCSLSSIARTIPSCSIRLLSAPSSNPDCSARAAEGGMR